MSYFVLWDGPNIHEPERGSEIVVNNATELDAVLDRVAEQVGKAGQPYAVQICPDSEEDSGIIIGVGHPDRSFVSWVDDNPLTRGAGDASAFQPDVDVPTTAISFDFFGAWTELDPSRTRVTPDAARSAAHEYIRSGQRPKSLSWT